MYYTSARVSSVLFLHNNKNFCMLRGTLAFLYSLITIFVPVCRQCVQPKHTTSKTFVAKSFFKNSAKLISCGSHDNSVAKNLKPWSESLHVSVCQFFSPLPFLPFFLFLLLFTLKFNVRMPPFLCHNCWIPVLWWANDAVVGALLKYFAPISVGRVQTPIL